MLFSENGLEKKEKRVIESICYLTEHSETDPDDNGGKNSNEWCELLKQSFN